MATTLMFSCRALFFLSIFFRLLYDTMRIILFSPVIFVTGLVFVTTVTLLLQVVGVACVRTISTHPATYLVLKTVLGFVNHVFTRSPPPSWRQRFALRHRLRVSVYPHSPSNRWDSNPLDGFAADATVGTYIQYYY